MQPPEHFYNRFTMPPALRPSEGPDPAALHIVHYPDKVLLTKAKPIEAITDNVREVAARTIELMNEAEGIGLAAPQVGLSWRMFVVHVPSLPASRADDVHPARSPDDEPPTATRKPTVYINPVLSKPEGAPELYEEGCLSLPEITGQVLRPPIITITATDLDGNTFTQRAAGLLARCWQHEMDHLDGVLILSRMSQMSRLKNRLAVKELERSAPAPAKSGTRKR